MKKTLSIILACCILLSCSATASFAYFGEIFGLSGANILNGKTLDITNGKLGVSIDTSQSVWKLDDKDTLAGNTANNPASGAKIAYKNVKVSPTANTDLTAKIDLMTTFKAYKEGGTSEIDDFPIVDINYDPEKLATPFEVFIGDMDNFGTGGYYDSVNAVIDPYSGRETKAHTIDVYPQANETPGTDRRMVNSQFFDLYTSLTSGQATNANGAKLWAANADDGMISVGGHEYYWVRPKSGTYSGQTIYFDGYTQRARWGLLLNNTSAPDAIINSLNYKFLQKAEPISFQYSMTEADKSKNIASVQFQIFVDDFQANGLRGNGFSSVSETEYEVYLIVDGVKTEISEFGSVINGFTQHGPIGNMLSFNLPSSYYELIKSASGKANGLQLLIDDIKPNASGKISGDSYAIDFAKMTVNYSMSHNTTIIKGRIIDSATGNPIPDCVVMASGYNGYVLTDANGNYEIHPAAGLVSLDFIASGYNKHSVFVGNTQAGVEKTAVNAALVRNLAEIQAKPKFTVNIKVQKYTSGGTATGAPITFTRTVKSAMKDTAANKYGTFDGVANHSLLIEPGSYFLIDYELVLKSQTEIGDPKAFNMIFEADVKAKVSQENNPAWLVDGDGLPYSFTPYPDEDITPGGGGPGGATGGELPIFDQVYDKVIHFKPTASLANGTELSFFVNSLPAVKTSSKDANGWYTVTIPKTNFTNPETPVKISVKAGNYETGELAIFITNQIWLVSDLEYNSSLTVHFYRPATWTGAPQLHLWGGNFTGVSTYPGVDMTSEGSGWYTVTVTGFSGVPSAIGMKISDKNSTNTRNTGDITGVSGLEVWYRNGTLYTTDPR